MNFQNNMMYNQPSVAPNPMDTIYNMFGGVQNFQMQANHLQQSIPIGMTPEGYANQLLQNGRLTQDRLNWAMQTANSLYGRR